MENALSERQETILALIIHEYIETGEPVGSQALVERYSLGISSATIRNEMAALTRAGLPAPAAHLGRPGADRGGLPLLRPAPARRDRTARPMRSG